MNIHANSRDPRRILILGYNSLEDARAKGLISSSLASFNVWYNPGNFFELSVVFIPFGKVSLDMLLSPEIRYVEWPFPRGLTRIKRFVAALPQLLRAVVFTVKLIRSEKLQVIRANGPHIPALIALLIRSVLRVPTVVFIEAFWERLLPTQTYIPRWLKRVLPLWYRLVVYQFFDVYCGTPTVDPDYFVSKGMAKRKISDWIHELDLEALVAEAETLQVPPAVNALSHPRLVAVGRLHGEKHPEDLVKVLAAIKSEFPSASLVLVGDGEEHDRLTLLATELGVENSFVITGSLPQAQGLAVVRSADIYVAPMQGNALVEAMAVGKPIVAYDHAWHRNLISDSETGALVPYRDFNAMAQVVETLLRDSVSALRLGEAAKTDALTRFGRDAVAQRLCKPFVDAWIGRVGVDQR